MGISQSTHYGRDIWLALKDLCLSVSLTSSTTHVTALILTSLYLLQVYRRNRRATRIRGPQSPSWVFGWSKTVLDSTATTELYERWATEYGPVYRVPLALGESRVILWDPKAISHFVARDTLSYDQTPFNKLAISITAGRGILWANGESHKRQRKALSPAFGPAAIRGLTYIFQDSAHKTMAAWDAEIGANQRAHSAVIDVQQWMNHITLDSTGIAVLAHDFGALHGHESDAQYVLNAASSAANVSPDLAALVQNFPSVLKLPLPHTRFFKKLTLSLGKICTETLLRTRKAKEAGGAEQGDKSCLGLLLKAEDCGESAGLTHEEVLAQARALLLGGFETTSVTMTWALIELARNPDVQTKLRDECLDFGSTPSYDDLTNKLPYLDAVVSEVLRLHPSIKELTRSALEEDVIPLGEPMRTAAGKFTDSVCIPKGTEIVIPLAALNCSVSMWGPSAKVFKPSRWLNEDKDKDTSGARESLRGYRHLMSFGDGPRVCLGRVFALTEFKSVMFVLSRNFVFEMADGPEVEIAESFGLLPRPSVVGNYAECLQLCNITVNLTIENSRDVPISIGWSSIVQEHNPHHVRVSVILNEDKDKDTSGARESLRGYRHLMSFGDGPRMCLGRVFALTEFKSVMFVLMRNFVFEMADSPGVEIVESLGLLPRPSVVGNADAGSVPLRVRRYEV